MKNFLIKFFSTTKFIDMCWHCVFWFVSLVIIFYLFDVILDFSIGNQASAKIVDGLIVQTIFGVALWGGIAFIIFRYIYLRFFSKEIRAYHKIRK